MKKERTIVIKNSFLRNLRNNLRNILIEAIWLKIENLKEKERKLDDKYDDPFEIDEYWENRAKIQDLDQTRINSITSCQLCTSSENDMVYIPENEAWYCTECQKKGLIVRLKDPREDHIVP
jgi:hypothetical protein